MRYVHFWFENGYAGCEEERVCTFWDTASDEDIDDRLEEALSDYGSEYEYVAKGYDIDNDCWENEEYDQEYWDNVSVEWEEITEQEYYNLIDSLNLNQVENYKK